MGRKRRITLAVQTVEEIAVLPRPDVVQVKAVYAFPTRALCPRCGSVNTVRYSTVDNVQYRKCQVPICRHTFKVVGDRIT